jgi:molybdate transport system substrate-binding protein
MALRILSAGAAQGIVARLAAQAGIGIEGEFGAVGAIEEKLRAGTPADVVILTRRQIDALQAEKKVRDAADLGRVRTGVAVRASDPPASVGDAEGLRAALLAADAIYVPDMVKSTAGAHFAKVLDGLGIRAQVAERHRQFPNGATAMREMARAAGKPVGCTQITEILNTPGARLVSALPKAFELATVYTASVAAGAVADAAARLVALLTGSASALARAEAGFEE